ncbi:MAG TPA: MmcQ/YjbR family DNA-binding protein [Chloroflexota bacterium]
MVTVDEVRAVVLPLPRSYEVFVHGRRKFRVGQIVYLAFSRDEATIGFAFPKEWRAIVVEAEPQKFQLPSASDMRFNWLHAHLSALDGEEMHDLLMDAWRMVVPKRVAAEWEARTALALRRLPQRGPSTPRRRPAG